MPEWQDSVVDIVHYSPKLFSNSGKCITQSLEVIGGAACWVFLLQQAGMRMQVNGPYGFRVQGFKFKGLGELGEGVVPPNILGYVS